ncbi:MAG TPA: hypothetical protein VK249_32875 [Anaerolineales bacterium]|nr:hypothetical protein [Anaerolineales bacterium]
MKTLNPLEFVGATLTIVGSFLPWERSGGFADYAINGIRVDIANFKYWVTGIHEFPVYDYGGVLVILLTLVIALLVLYPPRFIRNPVLWNLVIAAVLMASSLFFVGRGLTHVYGYASSIEPPTLRIGLTFVVLGSTLLLWKAIMIYRQASQHENKVAG